MAANPLIAVQEVVDLTSDAARAKAQAEAILDRLDDLRHGLLNGFVGRDKLRELSSLVRHQRARTDDPRLTEVLDQIQLRAEVELAKLSIKV